MTLSQEGKKPSTAELQKFIREKRSMEFLLITGECIQGSLQWFDDQAFSIKSPAGNLCTLLHSAVVGYWATDNSPIFVLLKAHQKDLNK